MAGHALIIEDELIVGLDLQAQLADLGYDSFAFAATEAQALEQARKLPPDLIIADMGLLAGDGGKAVEAILAERKAPVIYISGDRARLDLLHGDAPALEKPVTPGQLAEAVEQLAEP